MALFKTAACIFQLEDGGRLYGARKSEHSIGHGAVCCTVETGIKEERSLPLARDSGSARYDEFFLLSRTNAFFWTGLSPLNITASTKGTFVQDKPNH